MISTWGVPKEESTFLPSRIKSCWRNKLCSKNSDMPLKDLTRESAFILLKQVGEDKVRDVGQCQHRLILRARLHPQHLAEPAHPFFCKAQEEKPMAELYPNYKHGLFILVSTAPG